MELVRGKMESALLKEGLSLCGVDEVGKGCIAGPVYAAACMIDYQKLLRLRLKTRALIRDSKTLSRSQREEILPVIHKITVSFGIGWADVEEITSLGIAPATFLAMHRALARLSSKFDRLLIDGNRKLPEFSGNQQTIIKGDNLCYAIAAASIMAKIARDNFMIEQSALYPDYGFFDHVGYGTKRHLEALKKLGPTPLHRMNFAPCRQGAHATGLQVENSYPA